MSLRGAAAIEQKLSKRISPANVRISFDMNAKGLGFSNHLFVARFQKSDMIQHLREEPSNVRASTEAEEKNVYDA